MAFAVASIADNSEAWEANFDPVVVTIGGSTRCEPYKKQYRQKEGETRDLKENAAHDMFVKGTSKEVKGGARVLSFQSSVVTTARTARIGRIAAVA